MTGEDEVEAIGWIPVDSIDKYQWAFGHDEIIKEFTEWMHLEDGYARLRPSMTYFISGHRDLTWGLSDEDVEQAIHILNDANTATKAHL